jgi:NTE family protein
LNIICIGLKDNPVFALIGKFSFVFTGMLVVSVLVGLGYFNMLLKRFKDRGFGINPGKDFQDWVRDIMQEHHVETVSDFIEKAGAVPQGMHLRNGGSLKDLGPDVTLITSDIVTQNKIEFPKMWDLFTTDEKTLHPAQFVRASMSIPIFFESSVIQDIPRNETAIQQSWMKHLMTDPGDVPSAVRFVDGGILSNFPINIFYNPKIEVPRLPTFGIDLDDVAPEDKEKSRQNTGKMGLGGYMGRMFNTIRYYYDKDFLLKNSLFKKGIGRIDVHEFNWLDFSISDEKKVALFVKGAQAAGQFLQGFDWEAYKADRRDAFDKLNKVKPIQQSLTTAAV